MKTPPRRTQLDYRILHLIRAEPKTSAAITKRVGMEYSLLETRMRLREMASLGWVTVDYPPAPAVTTCYYITHLGVRRLQELSLALGTYERLEHNSAAAPTRTQPSKLQGTNMTRIPSLTINQHRLIQRLLINSHATDALAFATGLQNQEVSAALLPLCKLGLISCEKGSGQYALWHATDELRLALEERSWAMQAPKDNPSPAPIYILWSPTRDKALLVTYKSLKEAERVQRHMAAKNPGQVFHVCRVRPGVKAVQTTTYVEV